MEIVAVNDLVLPDNLAYLLRYDSVYGRYEKPVAAGEGKLRIDGREIPIDSEKNPENLPWKGLAVDVVFECTGIFRKQEEMQKHLQAGAKHVVLSAPPKCEGVPVVVFGANQTDDLPELVSCASCTTNCITSARPAIVDRRSERDQGHRRKSGEGDELVR